MKADKIETKHNAMSRSHPINSPCSHRSGHQRKSVDVHSWPLWCSWGWVSGRPQKRNQLWPDKRHCLGWTPWSSWCWVSFLSVCVFCCWVDVNVVLPFASTHNFAKTKFCQKQIKKQRLVIENLADEGGMDKMGWIESIKSPYTVHDNIRESETATAACACYHQRDKTVNRCYSLTGREARGGGGKVSGAKLRVRELT